MKPNGKIGCFCLNCKKCYVTKDPDNGWEESKLKISKEAEQDLKSMFNIDIEEELKELMRYEFRASITGDI